jgi:hypothetical protein
MRRDNFLEEQKAGRADGLRVDLPMSSIPGNRPTPTVAEVDRITALSDPITRNLWITQCYHELSAVLAERTGRSANWCTFATWASKQAGQTIRKEDLVRTLEDVLNTAPTTMQAAETVAACVQHMGAKSNSEEIQERVRDVLNPASAIDRASDAVGRGNRKVFAEIGREFARFFSTCLVDAAFDADKITRFCDELRPGDPPDGQRYLRQAFKHYYQSFFETDLKSRSELLLLANIEIGFHEQTRLQPEIAESLEAGLVSPNELVRQLIKALFPYGGWFARARLLPTRFLGKPTPLDSAISALVTDVRSQSHRIITEHMMTIGLSHSIRLRLGEDLSAEFPSSLRQIADPDLQSLLAQVDPTPNSTRESGAVDWADLPDRIHFIADMFRCYQETQDLFEPPFAPDQVVALKAGQPPSGRL